MVADLVPGSGGSPPIASLTTLNDLVVFIADDGVHGQELWRSDGTPEGTFLLKDIVPGSEGSQTAQIGSSRVVENTLFFLASEGSANPGVGLWKTDGTSEGTVRLKRFEPVPGVGVRPPGFLTNAGSTLYFVFADAILSPPDLWKTDGTEAGTTIVKPRTIDTYQGVAAMESAAIGDTLYFVAHDAIAGTELYRTDGTSDGTQLVADINPGFPSSGIARMTPLGDEVFFHATDGVHGLEGWKSDGTEEGTVLVKDFVSGPQGSRAANVPPPLVLGAELYVTTKGESGAAEAVWRTDGTPAGTEVIEGLTSFRTPVVAGENLYFSGAFAADGRSGWFVGDGTPVGSRLIEPVNFPEQMIPVDDAVFFIDHPSGGFGGQGEYGVWTAGADGQARLAVDLPDSLQARELTRVHDLLFFASGDELWKIDLSDIAAPEVTGQVWLDNDANGLLDGGDPGIPDVTVRLRGAFAGELLEETITDEQGAYRLRAPVGSEVYVEFEALARHIYTRRTELGDDEVGSHARRGAGVSRTEIFTVGGGFGGAAAPIRAGLVRLQESAPWQNPVDESDVNNDGSLTIEDLLAIVLKLREERAGNLEGEPDSMHEFIDVDGDNLRSISDLLAVIAALRGSQSGGGFGEGEAEAQALEEPSESLAADVAGFWPDQSDRERALLAHAF
jgi:ELWxxDGT repeat protein